jgi:hypothetical protein
MSNNWKAFRVVCLLQMLIATFYIITYTVKLFVFGSGLYFLEMIFFILVGALAVLGMSLLNTNYPDKPVMGKQKTAFNWLFLVNFLLIAYLFALLFAEYRGLRFYALLFGKSVFGLPPRMLLPLFLRFLILVFQFIIVFGLYSLRLELHRNFFAKNQFEFEDRKA